MWAPRGTRARERPSVGQKRENSRARTGGEAPRRGDADAIERRTRRACARGTGRRGGRRKPRRRGMDDACDTRPGRRCHFVLRLVQAEKGLAETTSVATAAGGMPNSEADGVSDRPIGPDRKSGNKRSEETREWSRRPQGAVGHPARLSSASRVLRPHLSAPIDRQPFPRHRTRLDTDRRVDRILVPIRALPPRRASRRRRPPPRWRRTTTTSCVA